MEELTILEKMICICGFVICPIVMFLVVKDILKDIKNMRSFGEEMFGEIKDEDDIKDLEEIKSINDIPAGYEKKLLRD